jgi:hypothetical protein
MRAIILSIVFYFLSIVAVVATPIDSLKNLLKSAQRPAEKVDLQLKLSVELTKQDFNLALDYAQQALFLARSEQNLQLQINACRQLATVFYSVGISDKAIKWLLVCRDLAIKAENAVELLNANINLGVMRIGIEDFKNAKIIFKEGDSLIYPTYQKLGQPVPVNDLIKLYSNLALCSFKVNEMSDGYLYIRKAEQLIDSIKASEVTYAKLLQVLGVGLIKEKKSKEAIEKLQFAEAIFEKTGEKIQLIVLRSFIGEAYTLDSNFKSAINEFSKGFTESEEFGIKQFMVQFSGSLSEVYQKIGNKDSAYKYLQLYTHLKDELKDANAKDQLTRTELTKKFEERERILNETYASKQKNYDLIIAFVLLLSVLLALSIFYYRRKYRVANLSELKLKLHAERLELEQEKLNSQLVNKENKLVELEQRLAKNAMLEDLVDELQIVQSSAQKTESKSGSSSENSKLIQQGKIWEEFEIRFAKTHAGFYDRLMQACPGLTTNERRLCAFLKLDMTTKEISTITGQSIRAIEIARTRLRKKLNLSQTETSLFEFLSSL